MDFFLHFHNAPAIVGTALLCGLIGLDRTAFGQFMISQPIVAAPLAGWILGDAISGIVIGCALELIWVVDMPIGNFVPANSTISAVSATAIAALAGHHSTSLADMGFCLLLTTAMVPVTMATERMVRERNSRLGMDEGASRTMLRKAQARGLFAFFLQSFFLCLLFVFIGTIAMSFFHRLPASVHRAMAFYVTLLPLLGAGMIIRTLSLKPVDNCMLAAFVVAAILAYAFQLHAAIVLGIITTVGWLGARYAELS